jgi:hypothetical protein
MAKSRKKDVSDSPKTPARRGRKQSEPDNSAAAMTPSAGAGDGRTTTSADKAALQQAAGRAGSAAGQPAQPQQRPAGAGQEPAHEEREKKAALSEAMRERPAASYEEVARRAYEIYRERGGSHGLDLEDWLQAERELRGSS